MNNMQYFYFENLHTIQAKIQKMQTYTNLARLTNKIKSYFAIWNFYLEK